MKATMDDVEVVALTGRFVLYSKETGMLLGEYRPPDGVVLPGDTLTWEGDLITLPE